MSKRIHIIVAESSTIIRCGVVTLLQRATNLESDVAEVGDVANISLLTKNQKPDLLIVNPVQLGSFSPSTLRSELGNESLRIVALQSSFADQTLLQGYDDVISIYDSADSITEKIVATIKLDDSESDTKKELSVREREIIVCVVKGMTNKQIADALCLSTHTIIAHRRNIASKLQIHSPSGLTIYAIVNKLVDIGDIKNSISSNKGIE
ncbi:MAG: response regulator transcription factor [Rikenellaceae bacterium]